MGSLHNAAAAETVLFWPLGEKNYMNFNTTAAVTSFLSSMERFLAAVVANGVNRSTFLHCATKKISSISVSLLGIKSCFFDSILCNLML